VSLLDEQGRPTVVERAFVVPPGSQLGPISEAERKAAIASSAVFGRYEKAVDRESAYEKLKGRAAEKHPEAGAPQAPAPGKASPSVLSDVLFDRTGPRGGKQSRGILESAAQSAARAIGSELGRQVLRGVLGSILGKRR